MKVKKKLQSCKTKTKIFLKKIKTSQILSKHYFFIKILYFPDVSEHMLLEIGQKIFGIFDKYDCQTVVFEEPGKIRITPSCNSRRKQAFDGQNGRNRAQNSPGALQRPRRRRENPLAISVFDEKLHPDVT